MSLHSASIVPVITGSPVIAAVFVTGFVPVIHAELLVTVTSAVVPSTTEVITKSAVVLPSFGGVVADQSNVGAAPPP